jgi:hypothetical protein
MHRQPGAQRAPESKHQGCEKNEKGDELGEGLVAHVAQEERSGDSAAGRGPMAAPRGACDMAVRAIEYLRDYIQRAAAVD